MAECFTFEQGSIFILRNWDRYSFCHIIFFTICSITGSIFIIQKPTIYLVNYWEYKCARQVSIHGTNILSCLWLSYYCAVHWHMYFLMIYFAQFDKVHMKPCISISVIFLKYHIFIHIYMHIFTYIKQNLNPIGILFVYWYHFQNWKKK